MKILIVDDSKVARNSIKKALSDLDNVIFLEANSGKDGWTIFTTDKPDLIFTDWYMDEMDGLELIKKIRSAGTNVKICMLTSETNEERMKLALGEGADYILSKPIRSEELARALEYLLG